MDNDSHVKLVLPANYVIAAASSGVSFPVIEEDEEVLVPPVPNDPPPYEIEQQASETSNSNQHKSRAISYSNVLRYVQSCTLFATIIFNIIYLFPGELVWTTNLLLPIAGEVALLLYILCLVYECF
jgi:hypothetical protein